jgi:hypothetical protein
VCGGGCTATRYLISGHWEAWLGRYLRTASSRTMQYTVDITVLTEPDLTGWGGGGEEGSETIQIDGPIRDERKTE